MFTQKYQIGLTFTILRTGNSGTIGNSENLNNEKGAYVFSLHRECIFKTVWK